MKIRGIIFDYGGVLVAPSREDATYDTILEAFQLTDQTFRNGLYGVDGEFWDLAKVGQLLEADYWSGGASRLNLPIETIHRLRLRLSQIDNIQQDLWAYIQGLKGRYQLAILSNALPSTVDVWKQAGFGEVFDVIINSGIVGMAKPDPAIYYLTLEQLQLSAEECIFVDDKFSNTQVGDELGMKTVIFQNTTQAIQDIELLLKSAD